MSKPTRHVSSFVNSFFDRLPEDEKRRYLIDKKIKKIHKQFAACVDQVILEHVNSIYLNEEQVDVSRETRLILTVYVDNSLIAAELNAQRELIILKYREKFSLKIDKFDIKISRGAYLDNHPFRVEETKNIPKVRRLSSQEEQEIENMTSGISNQKLRESFQRLLRANKEHQSQE